ncbi:MAG: acyl-CoA thioesterase [Planctomycetota bacterium]|jgi:acyl-CoA thioester hydrolase
MNYKHRLEFKVRDYECDIQGVVNNSVYQNYLEHARHDFLLSRGINFAEMTSSGIHLVVVRAELDYRKSLKSNDEFEVCTNFHQVSKLRFAFLQDIYRCHDQQLMLQAKIIGTSVNQRGRPFASKELLLLLGD